MVYLATGCAVIAVFLFSIFLAPLISRFFKKSSSVSAAYIKSSATQSDGIASTSFSTTKKRHPLWRLSKTLGDPFQPAVTWGQRRRISNHLERAGLSDWTFSQVYFLQCSAALLCVMAALWCLLYSLIAFRVTAFFALIASGFCGWWMPLWWLMRRHQLRLRSISRQFPFFLDMVGLGLDAGLNLQASVQLALEHVGEGALHQEWSKMLAEMRAGQSRIQALRQLSQRLQLPSMRQLISSLIQGESMGFSLGRIIQVYADQQRAQRLMHAEKQALQAPVKMLFPMALCIFPCTFIVLGFPVVVQLMALQ
jgi:tight adherence protein C